MLLEDEVGVANVIVPPPVYERCRLAVRTASFALVAGRLERRDGVINIVAVDVERLAVRETGRDASPDAPDEPSEALAAAAAGAAGALAAVAPRPHSFGRRG